MGLRISENHSTSNLVANRSAVVAFVKPSISQVTDVRNVNRVRDVIELVSDIVSSPLVDNYVPNDSGVLPSVIRTMVELA